MGMDMHEVMKLERKIDSLHKQLVIAEAMCKKYREALEYAYENYDKGNFAWEKMYDALYIESPSDELNNVIADELDRMAGLFRSALNNYIASELEGRAAELRNIK